MNSELLVAQLEAELRALERAREMERTAERRTATLGWLLSGAIGLIVLGFLLSNYIHFKNEWTEERLLASIQKELDALNPTAVTELHALGANLLPVYLDEGRRQFGDLMPQVSTRLNEELERFTEQFQAEVRGQLADTESRVRSRTTQLVSQALPSLSHEHTRQELSNNLIALTDEAVTRAIVGFDERFSRDVQSLEDVVMGFDVADTDEPTVELQKKFIRSWLALLDQEIQKL